MLYAGMWVTRKEKGFHEEKCLMILNPSGLTSESPFGPMAQIMNVRASTQVQLGLFKGLGISELALAGTMKLGVRG